MEKLLRVLADIDKEQWCISLGQVEDDLGVYWQMEMGGRWFTGESATECFMKDVKEYWATPIEQEQL